MQRLAVLLLLLVGASSFYFCNNQTQAGSESPFVFDTLAVDLTVPWEIVFMPDKTMLFTERNGKVRLYRNEKLLDKPALTITEIDTTKKMGLLGLCLHPNFGDSPFVYLAHDYRDTRSWLKVVRYRFVNDSLVDPFVIIDKIESSPNHTGCRLKFGPDDKLYITTGDADRPANAQDLKALNGKILRLNPDGTIPPDNPFISNDTARHEVWSYGHRNTQGIDFEPGSHVLFNSEHGPTGGDEVNIIRRAANYGWPVIHHRDTKNGMQSPLIEYSPSIGPSAIMFYKADAFPALKGSLLIASLRGEKLFRIELKNGLFESQEILLDKKFGRLRALATGPDGYIYFSTSQNDPPEGQPRTGYDMIIRMRPSGSMPYTGEKYVSKEDIANMKRTPANLYVQLCAGCHGTNLEGTERAKSMVDGIWEYGSSLAAITKSVTDGVIEKGMPAWEGSLSSKEISQLAVYIQQQSRKKMSR